MLVINKFDQPVYSIQRVQLQGAWFPTIRRYECVWVTLSTQVTSTITCMWFKTISCCSMFLVICLQELWWGASELEHETTSTVSLQLNTCLKATVKFDMLWEAMHIVWQIDFAMLYLAHVLNGCGCVTGQNLFVFDVWTRSLSVACGWRKNKPTLQAMFCTCKVKQTVLNHVETIKSRWRRVYYVICHKYNDYVCHNKQFPGLVVCFQSRLNFHGMVVCSQIYE